MLHLTSAITLKRLISGGWVMAALLLLWYNAAHMVSLMDEPIPGISSQARETIHMWQRLEGTMKEKLKTAVKDVDISAITEKWSAVARKKENPQKQPPEPAMAAGKHKAPKKKEVVLPTLQGIAGVYDARGRMAFTAMIDGRMVAENDRIKDFVVAHIDQDQVILQQGRQRWTLKKPEVAFSLDQGQ